MWRNHNTHREETGAVKAALNAAGINCTVGHGTGTAWSWLEINIGRETNRELHDKALRIAQTVTGRHGDYSGRINVYQQDAWNEKLGESRPIKQPYQRKQ